MASVKAEYEFRGLDFESDLIKLYSDVGAKMAETYDKNDFGPVEETSIRDDMTTEDIAIHKLITSEEKKLIKQGYLYIKEKIKNVTTHNVMLLYKAGEQEVGNSFMITEIFIKSFGMVHLPLTV